MRVQLFYSVIFTWCTLSSWSPSNQFEMFLGFLSPGNLNAAGLMEACMEILFHISSGMENNLGWSGTVSWGPVMWR